MPKKTKTVDVFADGQLTTQRLDTPKEFKEGRSRKFCLISYIDKNALEAFLKRSSWIQHWAMCTHDKDLLPDGTVKCLHTHILLYTYDGKTSSSIRKLFDRYSAEIYKNMEVDAQNTLCDICNDMVSQFRYLTHEDDPDKFHYERQCVLTDSPTYWHGLEASAGMTDVESNPGLSVFQ